MPKWFVDQAKEPMPENPYEPPKEVNEPVDRSPFHPLALPVALLVSVPYGAFVLTFLVRENGKLADQDDVALQLGIVGVFALGLAIMGWAAFRITQYGRSQSGSQSVRDPEH